MSLEAELARNTEALNRLSTILETNGGTKNASNDAGTAPAAKQDKPAAAASKPDKSAPAASKPKAISKPAADEVTKEEITKIVTEFLGDVTGDEVIKRREVITECLQRHGCTKMTALNASAYPQFKQDVVEAIAAHLGADESSDDNDPLS